MKRLLLFGLALSLFTLPALAQKKKKKGKEEEKKETPAKKPAKKKGDIKSIKEATKKCKKIEGLFTIYQDTTNGSAYLSVKADQIGKEFIYFRHTQDGSLFAGHWRGLYRGTDIFSVNKHYGKIELTKENTSFYFDPNNALSNAADANISKAIMASEKIIAQDSTKSEFLIKADGLFLSETLEQIKPSRRPGASPFQFKLGRLSKSKTKYSDIRNYPENTDIVVEYVYDNPSPLTGAPGVTDARYVSVKLQHSFIEVPDNDFKPRFDDPRIGFFGPQVTDMTSTSSTPYKDVISRWHLVKKDPNAALSEPVEPITWWIENTTPVEFRETIRTAVLQWNKAFEAAGFKNAVVVNIQPDDAEWDAGDIRYNVLRWTSSPIPPFGGFGPSFYNPRTGQILGADVMFEFSMISNASFTDRIFNSESFNYDNSENHIFNEKHLANCSMAQQIKANYNFGTDFLKLTAAAPSELKRMQKELLTFVALHEVGHTMGLMHNMKATQFHTRAELDDKELIKNTGLQGSVMDYPAMHVSKDKSKQAYFYTPTVGPYDKWVIEYGYAPNLTQAQLDKIASRSSKPELTFGNDADDMRSPGKAIDPRVMIWDMSNDAIGYSIERMEIVNDLMGNVKEKFTTNGQSYQDLRGAYRTLHFQHFRSAGVISRYIGGVYVDRTVAGQTETKPFTPVSLADQKRAMNALSKYLFAKDAFDRPNELYNYLQIQRRGFNHFRTPEDPKIHSLALNAQINVLNHLLHRNTLQRITDSELYGNKYTLSTMMTDLNNAIFRADATGNVNSFRQNLQLEYVKMLAAIVSGKQKDSYTYQSRSMAVYNLKAVRRIATNGSGNLMTKAHKNHLKMMIDKALENK